MGRHCVYVRDVSADAMVGVENGGAMMKGREIQESGGFCERVNKRDRASKWAVGESLVCETVCRRYPTDSSPSCPHLFFLKETKKRRDND